MINRWADQDSSEFIDRYGQQYGANLALRTYTTRLLGSEDALVLHGGDADAALGRPRQSRLLLGGDATETKFKSEPHPTSKSYILPFMD